MYRHILIPTDGSELAERAVTHGLSLAKSVGAKVSVIVAEQPFDWISVSDRGYLRKPPNMPSRSRSTPRAC